MALPLPWAGGRAGLYLPSVLRRRMMSPVLSQGVDLFTGDDR